MPDGEWVVAFISGDGRSMFGGGWRAVMGITVYRGGAGADGQGWTIVRAVWASGWALYTMRAVPQRVDMSIPRDCDWGGRRVSTGRGFGDRGNRPVANGGK